MDRYAQWGVSCQFVQDNMTYSHAGVLRGLHFQYPVPQGKLVSVLLGSIFDVGVDVRHGSPTFGEWFGIDLSESNRKQVFLPEGFAHGYCVTQGPAIVVYKCTAPYAPEHERSILWDDPGIGIDWPLVPARVSPKDSRAPRLAALGNDVLPIWRD